MSKKMGVAVYAVQGHRVVEVLEDAPGSSEIVGFAIVAPDSDPLIIYRDEMAAIAALRLLLWRPAKDTCSDASTQEVGT